MEAMKRRNHWETVYRTKATDALSWYQLRPTQSLNLLRQAGLTRESCVIDIGGGDSRLVDSLVDEGLTCLAVLDVSTVALSRAKTRLGERGSHVEWIESDVTSC